MDIEKILTKLRITELNEMQQHTAEAILRSDGDVVLLSPTGSGKTLAYLLPLIQLLDPSSDAVQALVVVGYRAERHGLWIPFGKLLWRTSRHGRAS